MRIQGLRTLRAPCPRLVVVLSQSAKTLSKGVPLITVTSEPLQITYSESLNGTEKILTFPDTGKSIALKIPKGIQDGQKIRIVYYGTTFLIPIQVLQDSKPAEKPPIPFLGTLFSTLFVLSLIGLPFFGMYHMYILESTDTSSEYSPTKLELFQYNLTHFPPSTGPHLSCLTSHMDTPRANRIREQALRIGHQLDQIHGYDLTSSTLVSVVPSLRGHGGIAYSSSFRSENCIQLAINNWNIENAIRHEWAHVATRGDAHGPAWREVAQKFGADTKRYAHCRTADHECQPTR